MAVLATIFALSTLAVQAVPVQKNPEAEFLSGASVVEVKAHSLLRHERREIAQKEQKKESSADEDPYGVSANSKWDAGDTTSNWMDAPDWAPPAGVSLPTDCSLSVTQDSAGSSDYGTLQHVCARCPPHHNCTDENKQQPSQIKWDISPALTTSNAFEVEFFHNWTHISQIGCSSCSDVGLVQKFKMNFSTNAGADSADNVQSGQTLHFAAWMGPEVSGGPTASGSNAAFEGKHVFEVDDTLPPRHDDCDAQNPAGRWLALPGSRSNGESFHCERICKSTHPCNCGRNTTTRCTATINMATGQVFKYKVKMVQSSANATYDGNTFMGTEWEVEADDLTENSAVRTVGRVVLAGNSASYGIEDISASHEHLGCVPCDLFYESTVIVGPFITDTNGNAHKVLKATAHPPTLGEETCQNYRMSAIQGLVIKHETGPGLWPSFQVPEELFTCPADT